MIAYSGNMWGKPHPDDLSRCENYADFTEKLNHVIKKLYMALRNDGRLAILVGDIRLNKNAPADINTPEDYEICKQFIK